MTWPQVVVAIMVGVFDLIVLWGLSKDRTSRPAAVFWALLIFLAWNGVFTYALHRGGFW